MRRELLSVREVAELCGVSVRTITRMRHSGRFPEPIKLNTTLRWIRRDVESWITSGCSSVRSANKKRRELDSTSILNLLAVCDGHSILPPAKLLKLGLPGDVCERLSETFKSDPNTPGGMIYVDGEPVAELRGVLGLDVLAWLAQEAGADTSGVVAFGRGTRAEQFKAAILAVIGGEQ